MTTLNQAVEFASVQIEDRHELRLTDKDGRVTIAGVRPGRCVVKVVALGWKVQEPDTITIGPGEILKLRHAMVGGPRVVKY